jgi:ribose-phosphate pyrophosphokinase
MIAFERRDMQLPNVHATLAPALVEAALALFALNATRAFGGLVADALGIKLAPHEERDFEDGEHKARPLEAVRGRDVYVIQSLYGDAVQSVNDKLLRLLFFLACLRDAGAARVTAVLPYLCYARKDARTQPNDPLTTRYVAQLLEAVGVECVVALEVHNPAAFQNAFRIRAEHIACTQPLMEFVSAQIKPNEETVIVSPDPGGFKRAQRLREALGQRFGRDVGLAFIEKTRALGKRTTGTMVGTVAGATAVIVDDIIASGGTLSAAAEACRAQGATRVFAAAAHGLFVSPANRLLAADAIERIAVSDSVPAFRLDSRLAAERLSVVSAAPLLARTIERLHRGESLAELER